MDFMRSHTIKLVIFVVASSAAGVQAAALSMKYGGPTTDGKQQFQVLLTPNTASAAAVEIGFQFSGGSIVQLVPNTNVFEDLNPGQNPFTGTATTGVSIHNNGGTANAAFAALGGVVPDVTKTLVLTVLTSVPGTLTLGGQNHNNFFTGARVWQGSAPTNGLTASLTVTGIEADFTGDGIVDGADLLRWQRNAGSTLLVLPSMGDANADGAVDGADLSIWEGQFGATAASTPAVGALPEPGTFVELAIGVLIALFRRRRLALARV